MPSVAVGYYQEVGIFLPSGVTCNGERSLLLMRSNPLFEEIYSLLLTATMSDKQVHFGPVVGNTLHPNGFCVIQEAALGKFVWELE